MDDRYDEFEIYAEPTSYKVDISYEVSVETLDGDMYGCGRYDSIEEAKKSMYADLEEFASLSDDTPTIIHIFEIEEVYRNDSICEVSDLEIYEEAV